MPTRETLITLHQPVADPASEAVSKTMLLNEDVVSPGGISLGFAPQILPDGRLQRSGRLDAQMVTFITNGATDVRVDHDLGRVPRRFSLIHATADIRVWKGTAAWTVSSAFFQSNGTSTVTVELA
jgi:hypothetical protein